MSITIHQVPLTPHQTRVRKSLENLSVPDWFRPSPEPGNAAQATPRWKRERSTRPGWRRESVTQSISSTQGPSSRASSTSYTQSVRSSPCAYQRDYGRSLSRTRHIGEKDISLPPPTPSKSHHPTTHPHTYKQPYQGWRSQEKLTTPSYLQTPAQRLAHSTITTVVADDTTKDRKEDQELLSKSLVAKEVRDKQKKLTGRNWIPCACIRLGAIHSDKHN